ncbi:uncharacterized protein STEHIDRAFT_69391 [Stereum hirsutum FP-91666 SS1]|uniref:CHAT domain-containing protein n=1 Tax=Stereum hirsutum (strain FP-91666) TaxID=721885 RepID=R7RW45_STEHR|nr:uncharacterized protein STEHIDRAFT_69391 [Stereum hirsutum FP-91666 SS1]EIM79489.1 hypothetical protein STEHIDRAFT_69391 [Stereum hirsutum FP-91666 SS1]
MEQSNWVHFACHASEHGFHLYDGRLQPQTIMRKSYTNARLAYLSACGTAESRRMFSRSHAEVMSMAGFRTVIAAMSPIADPDARIVAAKFYEYLFSGSGPEGKSAAVALHLAVAHLRECIGENDPDNVGRWAPFIHIGL